MFLPDNHDPDSFVNEKGKDYFLDFSQKNSVSIHKFIFNHYFKNMEEFIISNHLRVNLKQIENKINNCSNETMIPNWIENNMLGTKITPRTADFVEERFSRNKVLNLIKKYDDI